MAQIKIKKLELTEKDKLKAYKTAVRKAMVESGMNKITRSKIYRNKKKYTRKKKHQDKGQEND